MSWFASTANRIGTNSKYKKPALWSKKGEGANTRYKSRIGCLVGSRVSFYIISPFAPGAFLLVECEMCVECAGLRCPAPPTSKEKKGNEGIRNPLLNFRIVAAQFIRLTVQNDRAEPITAPLFHFLFSFHIRLRVHSCA